ncbi:MAG: hypothetical protein QHG99_02345 [Methanomicrobiales archaeon]|nr:hypothetical protein [Methanomicrobiales archaeon]
MIRERKEKRVNSVERKSGSNEGAGSGFWMYAAVLLFIALVAMIAVYFMFPPRDGIAGKVTGDACGSSVIAYINSNLVSGTERASLVSVKESNGMYEIVTGYQGQNIPVYASMDCVLLFLGEPLDVTEALETPVPTPTATQPATMVKTEKPVVDLYVMAFCPYGVQAENAMKPVVELLAGMVDVKVRYIARVGGSTVDTVQSLHGINEAKEDLRQLCIQKRHPDRFWSYLMQMNSECYPIYSNATKLDECWKNASLSLGIDPAEIEECAYGSEGIGLLKADEEIVSRNRVTGSPTLIINDARYSGARSPEAFKQAICGAFRAVPDACSVNLTSTQAGTSGQC